MDRATKIAITGLAILALAPASPARAEQQADAIGATVAIAAGLAIVCGTAAISGAPIDEDEHPFATRGPLITIGANAAVGPLGDGSKLANAAYGLNVVGGYRCNRHFASDVEFEWHDGYAPEGGLDLNPTVVTSNARIYVLTGRIQPYLLAGGGIMWVDQDGGETGIALRLGTGLDFYLTRSLLVNGKLDYVRAFQRISGTDYLTLSAGVGYRF